MKWAARSWPLRVPGVLWAVAGALLLFGVSGELQRFFENADLRPTTVQLAGGLSVSAWWAIFAGALVWHGFRR